MKKKIRIDKYCSEIDWPKELEKGFNLVVAGTGQGKTSAMMALVEHSCVGFVAPYVAVTNQVGKEYGIQVKVGMKAEESFTSEKASITSYHSIPRLLEMEHMDYLIIDEVHVLPGFSQFIKKGVIREFWRVVLELQKKFPDLKIVLLTATPHFIRLYPFDLQSEIYVEPRQVISKPKSIELIYTTKNLLRLKSNYLYLYPSKNMGQKQAMKYGGAYIDADNKDGNPAYHEIILGQPASNKRIFTSTSLSTGLSLVGSGITTAISCWMSVVDTVQFSSRIREGVDEFYVAKNIPYFFQQNGIDKPFLDWGNDFEDSMRLLGKFESWASYQLHENYFDDMLFNVLYQMIYAPNKELDWENMFY